MAIAEMDDIKPPAEVKREPKINKLFRTVMKYEASDLHLKVGLPPMMRLKGVIRRMDIAADHRRGDGAAALPDHVAAAAEDPRRNGGADFAHVVGNDERRFRVNLFKQRGHLGLVARRVNSNVPTFEKLGLPPSIEKLVQLRPGHDHPGRRDRVGQESRRSPRCSTTSTSASSCTS